MTGDRGTSARDLALAGEAAVLLTLVRLGLARLRFERVARLVGLHPGEAEASVDPAAATRIGAAVQRATGWVPFEATCLVQALAGARMLRRRRLAATVRLGVAKDRTNADGIAAHAWLHAGSVELTGGDATDRYTPVAAYRTA